MVKRNVYDTDVIAIFTFCKYIMKVNKNRNRVLAIYVAGQQAGRQAIEPGLALFYEMLTSFLQFSRIVVLNHPVVER